MCGIAGITAGAARADSATVAAMVAAMAHRGPDDSYVLRLGRAVFGCARLAIMGAERGRQPIAARCCELVLVCNGEVYSAGRSLSQPHELASASDCEVLLHLYRERGIHFLDDVEGQFALALFDLRTQELVLARDPFGIHPLYFVESSDSIAFASEPGALVGRLQTPPRLDRAALQETLLAYGPLPGQSWITSIGEVRPGTISILSPGRRSEHRYWDTRTELLAEGPDDAPFSVLVEGAVARRLRGASGPGVYVSGGVDSSTVAMTASDLMAGRPTLYGLRFADTALDEGDAQRLLAETLSARLVQPMLADDDLNKALPDFIGGSLAPLTRLGPVAMYLLSRTVHEDGTKFCLSGEGADELLLGYPVFRENQSSVDLRAANIAQLSLDLGVDDVFLQTGGIDKKPGRTGRADLVTMQVRETETKLSRFLLSIQGDRASLAHAVELRFPFLDRSLWRGGTRWTAPFAPEQRTSKGVLREMLARRLPPTIVDRPKRGFMDPSAMRGSSTDWIFRSDVLAGYLDPVVVQRHGLFSPSLVPRLRSFLRAPESASGYSVRLAQELTLLIATSHMVQEQVTARWAADRSIESATSAWP